MGGGVGDFKATQVSFRNLWSSSVECSEINYYTQPIG